MQIYMNKKLILAGGALMAAAAVAGDFHDFAKTPPRGWNSWDIYGTTVTEAQTKTQADAQAKYLLPSGYEYCTVDIQWYEPNAEGHVYKEGAPLAMDEYSRLLPAPNRFPSAAEGKGFKPLADYVHAKGLKFGIHYMRGIPRQAVRLNSAILGTPYHAADIALTNNTCCWNPDMFGVDMKKPGAEAYYDSLVAQWADWGVDLVKVDDIARPYDEVQILEIEALRKAIDKTGRAIVLSLSPGETPVARGTHVNTHANMWRVSDDFWDNWKSLKSQFRRLHNWELYRVTGSWPDADMLPFGVVAFSRKCRFTRDEQLTCMSLWCIARSPLIFGGDMTKLDDFTLKLLTNPEILAINTASENNRELRRDGDRIVWAADVPGSGDKYLALFNASDEESEIAVDLKSLGFDGAVKVRDLWDRRDEGAVTGELKRTVRPHACMVYRLAP